MPALGIDAPERYRVRPGGITAIRVHPGDVPAVTDPHGRQAAEVTVLSDDPRALRG